MEVRQSIDELRSSLEHITAEDELLRVIADRLSSLRQSFPSHRSLFTESDLEFLKNLGTISGHLRAFLELKEDLVSVNSLDEYEDIVRRLSRAKKALACFPVARRIAKEIRGLAEKLPVIRQQDEARRQFRLNARILDLEQNRRDLEQNLRRCPRRHLMVIREGTRGHFWGCSQYPFCSATAQLTPEENHFLNS
jgi:hypothetical protein